jgi:hypothetical protein
MMHITLASAGCCALPVCLSSSHRRFKPLPFDKLSKGKSTLGTLLLLLLLPCADDHTDAAAACAGFKGEVLTLAILTVFKGTSLGASLSAIQATLIADALAVLVAGATLLTVCASPAAAAVRALPAAATPAAEAVCAFTTAAAAVPTPCTFPALPAIAVAASATVDDGTTASGFSLSALLHCCCSVDCAHTLTVTSTGAATLP